MAKDPVPGDSAVSSDALERHEAELQLLIESIKDYAIFMLDPRGVIASWNPGAERIKGYRADEIIGRHFSVFYPEDDVTGGKCELELEVASATGRFEDEGWRVRKDGSRFWANVVISAVRDGAGRLVGFGKVTRDLTERRRAELERAARLAAEEASRTKDEFLAVLGHELRNPLAPIMNALELARLRGHHFTELDVIERQTRHIMRLVDDLLDVPRLARGKVDLRLERIELAEVVAQAIELAGPILEQNHHALTLGVPRHGCAVMGDRARLAQVVSNLITNAAKYSEPGGRVDVSAEASSGRVKLRVRDQGIGIEPAMLGRIFESYVQQPRSRDRSMGGLGLGLAIVRGLVRMHRGTVVARSAGPGKGSEFEIDLPLAPLEIEAANAEPEEEVRVKDRDRSRRRVLIVDDNVDAATLLAEVITALGHEVRVAHDGPIAIDAARELEPDVALVDIELPSMTGYELADLLGREPWAADLHVVAVTGHAHETDRQRSRAAGFHDHVVKPLDLATVRRIISGGDPSPPG